MAERDLFHANMYERENANLWSAHYQAMAKAEGWCVAYNTTTRGYVIAARDWLTKEPAHGMWQAEIGARADQGDLLAERAIRAIMAFNMGVGHSLNCVRRLSGNDYEDRRELNRLKNIARDEGKREYWRNTGEWPK